MRLRLLLALLLLPAAAPSFAADNFALKSGDRVVSLAIASPISAITYQWKGAESTWGRFRPLRRSALDQFAAHSAERCFHAKRSSLAYCGIAGLRPTYGRVSRYGMLPLAFSLDHVGPPGSCLEDCALAINAIAGQGGNTDFNLDRLPDGKGSRIGFPQNFLFEKTAEHVASAILAKIGLLDSQGAAIVETKLPDLRDVNGDSQVVQLAEASAVYANHQDASLFSPNA